jgi:hypothetical protein
MPVIDVIAIVLSMLLLTGAVGLAFSVFFEAVDEEQETGAPASWRS